MTDSTSPFGSLARLEPLEQLAVLNALDKKRHEDNFPKFWSPIAPQITALKQFTPDTKTFGILGGNRSGKTELGTFVAIAWALGKEYFRGEPAWEFVKDLPIPEPPNTVWMVGLDFSTLKGVIWEEKLRFGRNHPPFLPKDPSVVVKTNDSEFTAYLANGSKIVGKSADSGREKFQSASVDLVWIDEEPEVEIYDECYQRTVDCGGKLLLTLTPLTDVASGTRTPWVYELYEDWKAGKDDVKFVKLSVLDNPFVPEEEKDKLKTKWLGHYEEKARLYGDFVQKSGLVYAMWKPEVHMIKPRKLSRGYKRIVSIDPANTGMTAAVASAVAPNGDIYIYNEYYERDKIISDHATDMKLRFMDGQIDLWLIDPKWASQRQGSDHKNGLRLYRDAGIPVRSAEVGSDYGLNESREYLNATLDETSRHPKVYVFDSLAHFKHEIEHYTWAFFEKGEAKGLSKDKPVKRNDHLMNAFQYLCAMRPRGIRGQDKLSIEELRANVRNNSYSG